MNKISKLIYETNDRGSGAFIPYLMAGDPDPEKSIEYIRAIVSGGADIIELGVPFSDPVADGPTIQAAGNRALKATNNLEKVFELAKKSREEVEIPIILMSYYNPIMQFGETDFLKKCRETGINGVIVADLTAGEGNEVIEAARRYSVETPLLATPATDNSRLKKVSEKATGFLYLVARPGTTGAKNEVAKITKKAIRSVKTRVQKKIPVCVGFGLSSPDQVGEVIEVGADGAIVGSALVERVGDGAKPEELRIFVAELKEKTKL